MYSGLRLRFYVRQAMPGDEHEDHVFTSESVMQRLRSQWNMDTVTVAMPVQDGHLLFTLSTTSAGHLPVDAGNLHPRVIPVSVTSSFLCRSGLTLEQRPLVTPVRNLLPLTRVLIGTTIPLSQVHAPSLKHGSREICRTGDRFLSSADMLVIESEPVLQGLVTPDTSLTLVHLSPEQMKSLLTTP